MIDGSLILTFDGTIIMGLFVFYAFLVALAKRFEDQKQRVQISDAIRSSALVQLVFVVSAILVLFDAPNWTLITSTTIGLVLLIVLFVLAIFFPERILGIE
jgi:hypothetical protein